MSRYIILDVDAEKRDDWDNSIRKADLKFGAEEHDIIRFCNLTYENNYNNSALAIIAIIMWQMY